MQQIQKKTTQAGYTAAATIEGVWNSPGGYYSITGGSAYMELQYAPPGQGSGGLAYTNEVLVPVGSGQLSAGTTGVRFRDAGDVGGPAVVTAALSSEAEPVIYVGAPGAVTTTATVVQVTGIINTDGSIAYGSGFGCSRTGTGLYVVTFNSPTPFAAPPDVQVTQNGQSASLFALVSDPALSGILPTTAGFGVQFKNASNTHFDQPFSFIAATVA